jgi:hypothetical protein
VSSAVELRGESRAIQRVNPLADPRWDARLAGCPGATFFHGAAWARVLHGAYGFDPVYFTTGDGERLSSLLPVMDVRSWLTGRRGISLPFTDACAPLAADAASARALFEAARDDAKRSDWKYLECRGGRALLGDPPASTSFFGHRLDLSPGEARLFADTADSVRRAVRKADHSGLTITFSCELADVRAFYRLLGKTRKRHGLPAQPFRFFAAIHRHILAQNQGCVVLARHGGVPVAGAVFFHFSRTALYKFGASDERFQHLRANNKVMWEAIAWHAQKGFAQLDFGRTSLANAGLRRFKLGWGATEHPIDYVRYDLPAAAFTAGRDESSGWYNRLFRRLPVSLSRVAGALLYKHAA